jgi:hypothetical protein
MADAVQHLPAAGDQGPITTAPGQEPFHVLCRLVEPPITDRAQRHLLPAGGLLLLLLLVRALLLQLLQRCHGLQGVSRAAHQNIQT